MDKREKVIKGLHSAWNYIDIQRRTYESIIRGQRVICFDDTLNAIDGALELLGEYDDFCRFVTAEMLDKMNDCGNCGSGEIYCRKLVKLGYMRLEDDVYSEVEHG